MTIEILSCGIVSPGGTGRAALSNLAPAKVANSAGTRARSVFLVDPNLPELLKWNAGPRLRRASPISYYMIEAAQQALNAVPGIDRSRIGVVASFFLGCLVYTVRFYKEIHNDGRRFASPLLFPETVFNTPVSHLVSTLSLGGPVYTQIGDKSCWGNALRTAQCWLRSGCADHVLVLGAEEFDPLALDAFQATRLLSDDLAVGEGAGALLLSSKGAEMGGGIGVKLAGVEDGYGFTKKSEAKNAAISCLAEFPADAPILSTATRWTRSIEASVTKERTLVGNDDLYCEAFTASAAWDTIRGIDLLKAHQMESLIIPYWGLSQQLGASFFVSEPCGS